MRLVQGRSAITAYSAFIVADEILRFWCDDWGAGIVVGWYKSIGLKPQVRDFSMSFGSTVSFGKQSDLSAGGLNHCRIYWRSERNRANPPCF